MKINVAIIYGGRSAEHEVSINSAKNIMAAIDQTKYATKPVFIPKSGEFDVTQLQSVDVVFPVLHGPYGEDGTIQGMLKFLNIAFVGPDVLGSAIGMDKDVSKRLLIQANIPVAKFKAFAKQDKIKWSKFPCFVKPANLGSSVGISKVYNKQELQKAVDSAFLYDHKIIIEENIAGREIECSVLGNENPIASLPGEIVIHDEFYSYNAKYIDPNGAGLEIPAKLSAMMIKKAQKLAIKTFKVLCCEGMARVDFFIKGNKIFVNEINTIPGFTDISMYPKLWEASGISYSELIDRLITLAIDRHHRDQLLKTTN